MQRAVVDCQPSTIASLDSYHCKKSLRLPSLWQRSMPQDIPEENTGCVSLPPDSRDSCFGRERRLISPSQFRQVFEKNNRTADRYWTLLFRANELDISRLGMAVAKKRAKRAVDRNRLKRIIRESFRCQQILYGVDIVVLPRDASVKASNADLYKSLDEQWTRIAKQCAKHYA